MSALLDAISEAAKLPDEFSELTLKMDLATGDITGSVTPADLATGEASEPVAVSITKQQLLDVMGMEDGGGEGAPNTKPAAPAATENA
jgi:hypothetical protein